MFGGEGDTPMVLNDPTHGRERRRDEGKGQPVGDNPDSFGSRPLLQLLG